MARIFTHLTKADRIKIEALKKAGHSVKEIADLIHVHRSTIYRELKRGVFTARNSDLTEEERYSPDIADDKYRENLRSKGGCLKIGNDIKLANYIENKILTDNYSPAAVLGEIKAKGLENQFSCTICVTTLYSYIDKGIFLRLTNKNLPVKKNKKRNYRHVRKQAKASAGDSIEKRPEEIDTREDFGNWEMDTVKGKRGKSKNSLLVLTERKTRAEIIFKLPEHTAAAVVEALDRLERKWGEMFQKVFKTITMDNGSEFADCEGIERSVLEKGKKRVKTYYCHPYSSYERGSNENANKLIRRHVPKGTNFDDKSDDDIQHIENWINDYPRKIHGYHTSRELLENEIRNIG